MNVAGVYFASQKTKASLFDFILSNPPALSGETLIIGDFNTGLHRQDEAGATFVCTNRFERLPEIGLSDLWRRSHGPNAREYTWTSPQGEARPEVWLTSFEFRNETATFQQYVPEMC